MSLRDYFAAKAMQGIVAGDHSSEIGGLSEDEDVPVHPSYPGTKREYRERCLKRSARDAYAYADAMLAARQSGGAQ